MGKGRRTTVPSNKRFAGSATLIRVPIRRNGTANLIVNNCSGRYLAILNNPFRSASSHAIRVVYLLRRRISVIRVSMVVRLKTLCRRRRAFQILSRRVSHFRQNADRRVTSLNKGQNICNVNGTRCLTFLGLHRFLPTAKDLMAFLPWFLRRVASIYAILR